MYTNRRSFLKGLCVASTTLGITSALSAADTPQGLKMPEVASEGAELQIGDDIAIAETQLGKVKGYVSHGIYTFMGIPYAADTSGTNRFQPPQPREPWEGVRPTVFCGNSAPQDVYPRQSDSYDTFLDHWNYDELGEDCLYLNVWSPKLDRRKRPVLVWLHGGGFVRGNGMEQDGYHGEHLSQAGDMVFVSVNHRLGVFGFSDLSGAGGQAFASSGNVGMLDLVAALKWVRDNIAQFGGDPGNVTIMGQSGGGAKVCLLCAMPEAKGLFQRAVALSGNTLDAIPQQDSRQLGEYILKEAGLEADQLDQLQYMPWREYLDLAQRAARRMDCEVGGTGRRRGAFGPVADGVHIPAHRFFEPGGDAASDVPMLLCTTVHEWGPSRYDPTAEDITLPEAKERLRERYGKNTDRIVEAYAKTFPHARPVEVWSMILSSRQSVVQTANAKLHQKSPVYMAWFDWDSPLFGGRLRSFHCLDISFWFLNTSRMMTHTGGGPRPQALSLKMADALLRFMRTGDPNGGALPRWPRYTRERGETMVLSDTCELKNDPDHAARQTLPA